MANGRGTWRPSLWWIGLAHPASTDMLGHVRTACSGARKLRGSGGSKCAHPRIGSALGAASA